MEVEKNTVIIIPSQPVQSNPSGKRPSITSSKFEIRKLSDTNNAVTKDARSVQSKLCFRMADMAIVMLILFPLSIGFWRGVWQIMDYYSELWGVGPWLSTGIGYSIPFFMYWYQEPLKKHVVPGKMHFVAFYLISRTLLLIHSFGSVNQWRGLWKLIDDLTGLGLDSCLQSLLFGIFFSLIFKTFSNVLAPPLMCCVDEAYTIHDCPLRFKTPPHQKWRYFWDCLFSVLVIPSLTVCCWRGVWNLADLVLYPDQPFESAMASLGFGYVLCIIMCSLQPLICEYICTLKGLVRLSVMDLTYMLGFLGCVFAWRGVWNSYNLFLKLDTPLLSEWISLTVGSIGCVLLGCVSIVMVRGIVIDGELMEDEAAEWLIPYVSHLRTASPDVPFPEPWIFRYLCTSQKMNSDKTRRSRIRKHSVGPIDHRDGAVEPLQKLNCNANAQDDELVKTKVPPNSRVRLSRLPHIDSSSEESLGARETMSAFAEGHSNQSGGPSLQDRQH